MKSIILLSLLAFLGACTASQKDSAMETYVSRPDIRNLRMKVELHETKNISQGLTFVSLYGETGDSALGMELQTSLAGPHIYDIYGNLVWSGAHLFPRRKTYDFKAIELRNEFHLSFILDRAPPSTAKSPSFDPISPVHPSGAGMIVNQSYEIASVLNIIPENPGLLNIHEFKTLSDGVSILALQGRPANVTSMQYQKSGVAGFDGFMEIEILTGNVLFQWTSEGHIDPSESYLEPPSNWGQPNVHWDFMHMNSVEKTHDGNYIVSCRYTSTIYYISGTNGSVLWRLGGKLSTFELDGFNFSSQHDARLLHQNSSAMVLSLLDNAASEIGASADASSALILALDLQSTPRSARLSQRFERPDSGLTTARGNMQSLSNGNVFIGWSDHAYLSEHTSDGHCVMEAQLIVPDYATYRAYKFNFSSTPIEQPVIRSIGHSTSSEVLIAHYVSWNGATEVATWRFFGSTSENDLKTKELGAVSKTGFESVLVSAGYVRYVQAQAIDSNDNIIGETAITDVEYTFGPDNSVGRTLDIMTLFIGSLVFCLMSLFIWSLSGTIWRSSKYKHVV